MNPDVVVDVGNTRIKWGLCAPGAYTAEYTPARGRVVVAVASLPPNAPEIWQRQLDAWRVKRAGTWALASVQPRWCDALVNWLRAEGHSLWVLESYRQLPLEIRLRHPDKVGMDRLLNAVAVTKFKEEPRLPAIVADAGSAVTVDWIDEDGGFAGGAIFPGLRLMAQALRDHTALLPLVHVSERRPPMPGMGTASAIKAGVYYAVAGGVNALIEQLSARARREPYLFLTGGDALLLSKTVDSRAEYWPEMTLEGIRLSAEAQP
jgi:type III pantothenate kinase